jgi:hypothetical protein
MPGRCSTRYVQSLQGVGRDLPDWNDPDSMEVLNDPLEGKEPCLQLLPFRFAIRQPVAVLVGMPGECIPKYCVFGEVKFAEGTPYDCGGRFAPGPESRG